MNCPVDTNPKTIFGQAKPGISSIPPVALLHLGRGMDDGAAKYGLTNWREHEVSASVYYNAAGRHLMAWWDGEQNAPDSGVHHLGHVMACCAILLDAEHMGKLNDNRPAIPGPFAEAVKAMTRPMNAEAGQELESGHDWSLPIPEMSTLGSEAWGAFIESIQTEMARATGIPLDQLSDGEPDLDAGVEELALRVHSSRSLDEIRGTIRSFLNGEWDKEDEADTPDDDFGEALGEPDHWDDWSEAPMAVGFETGSGLDAYRHAIEVKTNINYAELDAVIAEFLKGDQGSHRCAEFNNFRRHIGSFQHSLYSQSNRTRLAFYLTTRMTGVPVGARGMDEALRQAGLEFGSV